MIVVRVASTVWIGAMLLGCGAARTAVSPAAPEPATAKTVEPPPAPPAPALPFHLPCSADDVVGCTNACNDKFVEDCVTLGVMYLQGMVVSVDRERAVTLFHTACDADSARGCMRLADAYHAGIVPPTLGGEGHAPPADVHAEEVLLYRRACDGGANQGCVLAGRALATGHGVERDAAQAAKLFTQVCERGNAEACLELGKLMQQGEGVVKNPDRALSLFRKACGLGLEEACLYVSPKGEQRSPRQP